MGNLPAESRPDTGTAASLPALGLARLRCLNPSTRAMSETNMTPTATLNQDAGAARRIVVVTRNLGP